MSLSLVRAIVYSESSNDLHVARMLILLDAVCSESGPLKGITKLAKLDFLLRYPNCLERALSAVGSDSTMADIAEHERNSIEAKMMRFRYGPWDDRYRRWIGLLVAMGLGKTYAKGRTVYVELTEEGRRLAGALCERTEFESVVRRSRMISHAFGKLSGTRLKDFIYATFPEITDMKWGDQISI